MVLQNAFIGRAVTGTAGELTPLILSGTAGLGRGREGE